MINFSIFIDILKNIKVGCWLNYDFQNNSELSMAADQNRIFNKGSSIWLHKEAMVLDEILYSFNTDARINFEGHKYFYGSK